MNEVEIKKMSLHRKNLLHIADELNETKCHICNDRLFEGGYNLGELSKFVCNQIEKINDEEEHEEDEEDEDEDDAIDYENMYLEEHRERKKVIYYNQTLIKHKETLVILIKSLITCDKVYPGEVENCIKVLCTVLSGETETSLFESLRPNALKLG